LALRAFAQQQALLDLPVLLLPPLLTAPPDYCPSNSRLPVRKLASPINTITTTTSLAVQESCAVLLPKTALSGAERPFHSLNPTFSLALATPHATLNHLSLC
jgi:hypothetical protein